MNIERIFTEEPEYELWRRILQYSYKANIKRYFDENGISVSEIESEKTYNSISGAILQADEYYRAGKSASLQIEPLLLYYGSTNLLYALYFLKNGSAPVITNHGMRITNKDQDRYIADTEIKFESSKDGAVHKFASLLGVSQNLCDYRDWTLHDFLDSIAEISSDYEKCYEKKSCILLLDTIQTTTGAVEKLYLPQNEYHLLQNVEKFSDSYLTPQVVKGELILRHKMAAQPITLTAYSGQTYLQVAHFKENRLISLPAILNMYISLFALSSLCRYNPGRWNPFVTQDSSGERLVLEKLLYFSRRMIPNAVLNEIVGKQMSFVSDKYVPENRVHLVGEHEVQEIVNNEVRKQIKEELARTVFRTKE